MDDTPHLILEVSESADWPTLHPNTRAQRIPDARRPVALQPTRETAENEALRLARQHPDKRFAVFAPVLLATTVAVPTHVTLSGKIVAHSRLPKLLQVDDPNTDVPF